MMNDNDDVSPFLCLLKANIENLNEREQQRFTLIRDIKSRLIRSYESVQNPGILPSERTLADEFNCSRVPVREALTVLKALGFLKIDRASKLYQARLETTANNVGGTNYLQNEFEYHCTSLGTRCANSTFSNYLEASAERRDHLSKFLVKIDALTDDILKYSQGFEAQACLAFNEIAFYFSLIPNVERIGERLQSLLDLGDLNVSSELGYSHTQADVDVRHSAIKGIVSTISEGASDIDSFRLQVTSAFESYGELIFERNFQDQAVGVPVPQFA